MSLKFPNLRKAQTAPVSRFALTNSAAEAESHPATRIEFHFCATCGAAVPASAKDCFVCAVEARSRSTESR